MTLDTDALALLASFADDTTLRASAQRLSVPRSTISRRLAELEARLGHDVFLRRGRVLVPTAFGRALIARAKVAHEALALAEQTAAEGALAAQERLTIATSPLFAELVLPPVLAGLAEAHPRVRLEVRLSHEYSAIHDDEVDVALRRGPLPDSTSLRARKLGRTTMVMVAAPTLARRAHGTLQQRLAALPFVRVGARLEPVQLALGSGRRLTTLTLVPRLAVDSQRVALELVERGVGMARLNLFFVRDALARGAVVEVVPEARSSEDVFAVSPERARAAPLVRELTQRVVEAAREAAIWE